MIMMTLSSFLFILLTSWPATTQLTKKRKKLHWLFSKSYKWNLIVSPRGLKTVNTWWWYTNGHLAGGALVTHLGHTGEAAVVFVTPTGADIQNVTLALSEKRGNEIISITINIKRPNVTLHCKKNMKMKRHTTKLFVSRLRSGSLFCRSGWLSH